MNITGPGQLICNGSEGATTRVTFLLQHGSLPNMTADIGNLASTTGTPSVSVIAKGQVNPRSLVGVLVWFGLVWCLLRRVGGWACGRWVNEGVGIVQKGISPASSS